MILLLLLPTACQTQYEFAGTVLPTPQPLADISLESEAGPVSLQDFKGKYTLIYFGYTFCPDVCPITLAKLKKVKADLDENADQLEVVMITVDPERDTPEHLAEYVHYFDSTFIGLSGDIKAIEQFGKPFGLYYYRHEGSEATGYLVDHTTRVFLLDSDTNLTITYSNDSSPDDIVRDLEYLMKDQ